MVPPNCPKSGALLAFAPGPPRRCVRCHVTFPGHHGPERPYWCGAREESHDGPTVDGEPTPQTDGLGSLRFPGYRVEGLIGSGGGGQVYEARDGAGARVALKVLGAGAWAEPRQRLRFQREIAALSGLTEPHVLPVLDAGTTPDGVPWFTMPLVEGPSLRQVLDDAGSLSPDLAVAVCVTLAETLVRLHAQGVVHRDLKPSNILFHPDGAPVLADFGLALDLGEDERLTRTRQLVGTPRYMAPEQRVGLVDDWERVDQYALAVVLHESLGGDVRSGWTTGSLPVLPTAPRELRWMLERAAAADPGDRYPSLAAFLRDLVRWRDQRTRALLPLMLRLRGRSWLRRHRLGVAVALGLGVGTVAMLTGVQAVDGLRDRARERGAQVAWTETRAQLEASTGRLEPGRVAALFDRFAQDPAHVGTRAATEAFLWLAERRIDSDDADGARAAFGRALLASDEPTLVETAAARLLALYLDNGDLPAAELLVSSLGERAGPWPQDPDLLARLALARRDLARAKAWLSPASQALLSPLAHYAPVEDEGERLEAVDSDGDGRPDRVEVVGADEVRFELSHDTAIDYTLRPDGHLTGVRAGVQVLAAQLPANRRFQAVELADRLILQSIGTDLWVLEAGEARPLPIDRPYVGNYPLDLVRGDLTGDGSPEVVVLMGPPHGYSIEVLTPTGAGLRTLATRRLGTCSSAVVLQTSSGPRLVVAVAPEEPAPQLFPDDPWGGAARLEVLRLDGDQLVTEQVVPIDPQPRGDRSTARVRLFSADLDGDGHAELLAGTERLNGRQLGTLVLTHDGAGRLTPLPMIHGVAALGVLQADTDVADEVLAWVRHGAQRRHAVLGTGDQPLDPLRDPAVPVPNLGPALLDALGLDTAAAEEWQLAAAASGRTEDKARAAAAWARSGEHVLAVSLQEGIARTTSPPNTEDLSLAVDYALAGRLEDEAARLLAELPDTDPRALWLQGWRTPSHEETFERPLHPAWQLASPALLSQDLVAGRARVTLTGIEASLRLPLRATGDPVSLRLSGEILRNEGGNWSVVLRPVGSPERALDVAFNSRYWATRRQQDYFCTERVLLPSEGPEIRTDFQVLVGVDATGLELCDLTVGDVAGQPVHAPQPRGAVAGEAWELLVVPVTPAGGLQAVLALDRLALTGLEPVLEDWRPPSPDLDGPDGAAWTRLALHDRVGEPGLALSEWQRAWGQLVRIWPTDPLAAQALRALPDLSGLETGTRLTLRRAQARALWSLGLLDQAQVALDAARRDAAVLGGWQARAELEAFAAQLALVRGDRDEAAAGTARTLSLSPDRALGLAVLRAYPGLAPPETGQATGQATGQPGP